jgi:hypothetical protein
VVYGREGGQACDVFIGTNLYDDSRVITEDEADIVHFVVMSISHQHFAIDRRGYSESKPRMFVKDLSLNGTFVSREGGEYKRADRVEDGKFDGVRGRTIAQGSRIRLGESSDHILEVMTDEAASELILIFESLREETAEEPPKKKRGLFGFFSRK